MCWGGARRDVAGDRALDLGSEPFGRCDKSPEELESRLSSDRLRADPRGRGVVPGFRDRQHSADRDGGLACGRTHVR